MISNTVVDKYSVQFGLAALFIYILTAVAVFYSSIYLDVAIALSLVALYIVLVVVEKRDGNKCRQFSVRGPVFWLKVFAVMFIVVPIILDGTHIIAMLSILVLLIPFGKPGRSDRTT